MIKKTCKYMLLLITAVSLMLSGCSGDGSEKKSEDSGSVLTLQMRQPESFNPLKANNHSVRDAFSLCYEPLFEVGADMKAAGVLAQNIKVSDDCLSAVVLLKDSIMWHDGVKLTSADVVYTINMLKENPSWEYSRSVKNIETVQAIDPLSFKIVLSRPYGQIAYSLNFPVIAEHNSSIDDTIIGTGEYCFEKYNPATMIELKKFDKWHGGEASCDKVNINIIRDSQTATTSFNTGLLSAITSESFDVENNVPKENTVVTAYHSNEFEFMAFNHSREIFKSPTVRSAISSAIDRSSIASESYTSNAVPANSPLHPEAQEAVASSIASQYSLAHAGELLFLEGYVLDESTGVLRNSNGKEFSFELLVNSENQSRVNSAHLLCRQLFAAGINVTVTEVSFEEYSNRIKRGEFDAYLGGTRILNMYDFEFLLSDGGSLSNYGYHGEFMAASLSALASSSTEDALVNAVLNFEEVFLREQPVCGLVFRMENLITAENVEGDFLPQMNNPYSNLHGWNVK